MISPRCSVLRFCLNFSAIDERENRPEGQGYASRLLSLPVVKLRLRLPLTNRPCIDSGIGGFDGEQAERDD